MYIYYYHISPSCPEVCKFIAWLMVIVTHFVVCERQKLWILIDSGFRILYYSNTAQTECGKAYVQCSHYTAYTHDTLGYLFSKPVRDCHRIKCVRNATIILQYCRRSIYYTITCFILLFQCHACNTQGRNRTRKNISCLRMYVSIPHMVVNKPVSENTCCARSPNIVVVGVRIIEYIIIYMILLLYYTLQCTD